ncbi:MAG: MarR family transcriptional regulator [Rhizobiaceae bacterium]
MKKPEIIVEPITSSQIAQLDNIMLLFFAYRDFTGDADRLLAELEFGRAHHRVMFFINRKPGLSVAELLEILSITKQSLARVLRQLIDEGYVYQRMGKRDRRKRLLYPTDLCRDLIYDLSVFQSTRIEKALAGLSAEKRDVVSDFLTEMIDVDGRKNLRKLLP